jgi:tubulin--tyrosine ligase
MGNCFELYGLDFMVDEDLNTILLEVNPGPDFKQTGDRLKRVIADLMEQTCCLIFDEKDISNEESQWGRKNTFHLVYDKQWSASALSGGGMTMK